MTNNALATALIASRSSLAAIALLLAAANAAAWHEVVVLEHTSSGKLLSAKGDGSIAVDASTAGAAEKFTLLDLNFGRLVEKDPVALRSFLGRFVTGLPPSPLTAMAPTPGRTETFVFMVAQSPSCAPAARPGQCDGVVIQLKRTGDDTCLAADPAGGAVTARPCGALIDPDSLFRVRFPPEQPALLSLSGPFDAPQAMTFFGVTGVDHSHMSGGSNTPSGDCTDAFGHRRNCYRAHEGTDFPMTLGPVGQVRSIDVLAVAPGFVVNVDNNFVDNCFKDPTTTSGYRCPGAAPGKIQTNIVSVVQDDGVIARYAHLKRGSVPVSIGQRVECGTVVGKVGSSGRSGWSHLHFDMAQLALPQPTSCANGGPVLPLPTIPAVAVPGTTPFDEFAANSGPQCGKSTRLDPYDPAIAAPRETLWLAVDSSRIPKQFCAPSKKGLALLPGGPGASCSGEFDCRPWLVCATSATCEPPRDVGQTCNATRDCGWSYRCENGLCTRHNVFPGRPCNSVNICGPGLVCARDVCGLDPGLLPGNIIAPGEDGCPPGERLRCPFYRTCVNPDDQCQRLTRSGWVGCERECSP